MSKIRAGIIGATGYAGAEIIKLLAFHPEVEIVFVGSRSYADQKLASIFGNLYEIVDLTCIDDDTERMKEEIYRLADQVDVIFTATPQGACASFVTKELLEKVKVIDLSADFRLKDVAVYEHWYKIEHKAPELIENAVYGLVEVNREKIPQARLLANPGCYTTCSILTAYPLVKEGLIDPDTLIVDALSGVSGAGRGGKVANLYCEVNESAKAYGVATHRHTPEIEEQLGYACGREITVTFTPHLAPMNRGILVTAYASLVRKSDGTLPSGEELRSVYSRYYDKERFIRVLPDGVCPETRFVEGSNYLDVNCKVDPRTGRVIMMGALDNLMKGAASQAVQNMNLMFGLPEETGISMAPVLP
ncbi:MAG: N-acetyl-gamma-glutamyl-phosphate reductase [Eubacteriales bacterium]|nr:N-acetyl-gamma-glutamyl-phosphate reductase [Eubacteriales bacterium]